MADPHQARNERFEQTLFVAAPPATVFACFFSADALRAWWQAVRSVTTPVPFGVYAIEWATTPYRDEVLGALGGVFHGTVVEAEPGRQFYVADAYWIAPESAPIGPMGLQVTCTEEDGGCKLHVKQDGYENSPRWQRYYAITARGWQVSLIALKRYAETTSAAKSARIDAASKAEAAPKVEVATKAEPAPKPESTPKIEVKTEAGASASSSKAAETAGARSTAASSTEPGSTEAGSSDSALSRTSTSLPADVAAPAPASPLTAKAEAPPSTGAFARLDPFAPTPTPAPIASTTPQEVTPHRHEDGERESEMDN